MMDEAVPSPVQSPLIAEKANAAVRHGFFTREGGVSTGIYAGLNVGLGSSDVRESVEENRARVSRWFGVPAGNLATVHQVHSPTVHIIEGPYDGRRPEADALVTSTPGIVLGVLSADCGPVLFVDAEAGVVGAAHAGWKGALTGVLENTIRAMETLGARRERIAAALGPSISRRHYEVGPEFVERFIGTQPGYEKFFGRSTREGHAMFDLPALTIERLTDAGVTAENLDLCTYPDEDRFFSYRRTTHRQEPDYGRQISAIMIQK
ncbi:peptidoglycan editing factor PgeF [Sinorhizobium sp. BG8]|uniref:peptidoglycan editing factor PgeF n=1 Tax=Sinorhizobium sp. BG8 TaxID=2613773 RepID=UPI00193C8AE8|nr:peptidoglycan editing factor PgeF [Sinorhizobium sp. BG8]QRM56268.1 peptidoglycan editing factor PgeF [Sinorhizobium sp. BG8]